MAEKEQSQKAPGPKLNLALMGTLVLVVANLAATGVGVLLVYKSSIGFQPTQMREGELQQMRKLASESDVAKDLPLLYTMEKITANLAGEPKRMIQVEMNVEFLNKEGFSELLDGQRRAKVRDGMLRILGDRTFDEVESIQGKLFLKDSITEELNSILDKGVVKNIYFSHFVVR
jgi:flagellar protein FliL